MPLPWWVGGWTAHAHTHPPHPFTVYHGPHTHLHTFYPTPPPAQAATPPRMGCPGGEPHPTLHTPHPTPTPQVGFKTWTVPHRRRGPQPHRPVPGWFFVPPDVCCHYTPTHYHTRTPPPHPHPTCLPGPPAPACASPSSGRGTTCCTPTTTTCLPACRTVPGWTTTPHPHTCHPVWDLLPFPTPAHHPGLPHTAPLATPPRLPLPTHLCLPFHTPTTLPHTWRRGPPHTDTQPHLPARRTRCPLPTPCACRAPCHCTATLRAYTLPPAHPPAAPLPLPCCALRSALRAASATARTLCLPRCRPRLRRYRACLPRLPTPHCYCLPAYYPVLFTATTALAPCITIPCMPAIAAFTFWFSCTLVPYGIQLHPTDWLPAHPTPPALPAPAGLPYTPTAHTHCYHTFLVGSHTPTPHHTCHPLVVPGRVYRRRDRTPRFTTTTRTTPHWGGHTHHTPHGHTGCPHTPAPHPCTTLHTVDSFPPYRACDVGSPTLPLPPHTPHVPGWWKDNT